MFFDAEEFWNFKFAQIFALFKVAKLKVDVKRFLTDSVIACEKNKHRFDEIFSKAKTPQSNSQLQLF